MMYTLHNINFFLNLGFSMNTICFVAGKSGGHLLPCITYAHKLIKKDPSTRILFFSTQQHLDKIILKKNNFITSSRHLPMPSLNKKSILSYIHFIVNGIFSFAKALYYLIKQRPSAIISMGGSVSIPVCIAGALLRIPIQLIELNAVPGKTIKFLAPLAQSISVCFKETSSYFSRPCFLTEYPLRFNQRSKITTDKARLKIGLDRHKTTIFILGGSQGSLFLNSCIKKWIQQTKIPKSSIQLIHQIGHHDTFEWGTFYKEHNIAAQIFSFSDTIEDSYNAADIVICRAGAGSLFELSFFNKMCIIIPLETAYTDHQVANAQAFKKLHPLNSTVLYQKEIINNPLLFNTTLYKIVKNF